MIALTALRAYFKEFETSIADVAGVTFVATENQAAIKMKDKIGIQMVATYPLSAGSGDNDNRKEAHSMLLFVLFKNNNQTVDDEAEFNLYDNTLKIIDEIRGKICEDFSESHYLWRGLSIGKTETDAIFNMAGWSGWSLLLEF